MSIAPYASGSGYESSHKDPDADLIPRIIAGDQSAFSDLVERHMRTITGLATHMLGDPFAAEDITQAVFLKTWQHLPKWQSGQAKLITWMRRVATNMCLDRLKKKAPLFTDKVPEKIDGHKTALEQLEQEETAKSVRQAMMRLPHNQRAALTLCYFNGASQKEGAQIMDVTVSAFDSLLRRARQKLKSELIQAEGD